MILNVDGNCIIWVYNKKLIQFQYLHIKKQFNKKKTKLKKTGILNVMTLSLEKKQKNKAGTKITTGNYAINQLIMRLHLG